MRRTGSGRTAMLRADAVYNRCAPCRPAQPVSRHHVMNAADLSAILTRRSGSNFYYSFLFLPKRKRHAIYALYAFCRTVDDAVDQGAATPSEQRRILADWRLELGARVRGPPDAADRPASRRGGPGLPRPAPAPRGDPRRRRDGHRQAALRLVRGALRVLLPGGGGGRSGLHRGLRLHGPPGPGLRGQPGSRAPAHEHHARPPHGRRAGPHLPAARRDPAVRVLGGRARSTGGTRRRSWG